jgi:tRNA splicing ligase
MLIFGGILEVTREVNDMYAFDLGAKKWKIIFKEALKQRSNSLTNISMTMESQSPTNNQNTINKQGTIMEKSPSLKKLTNSPSKNSPSKYM